MIHIVDGEMSAIHVVDEEMEKIVYSFNYRESFCHVDQTTLALPYSHEKSANVRGI